MRLAIAFILLAWAGLSSAMAAPQPIEIPVGTMQLRAFLYKPPGEGPFAAIVALHGCSGLNGRSGPVALLYRDWGERLAAEGFAVVFPDSFGSRGQSSQCSIRERAVRTWRERVSDADAARQWLQHQSWVSTDRISILGWSNGAAAALWTVRRGMTVKKSDIPDFRSAVALYPGCRRLSDAAWSARIPTLILIGGADDWSSPALCQQMVSAARGRSAQVSLIQYPGAYHDFDQPNRPVRQQNGLAFTANDTGQAHSGTDPTARADALRRVPEWLAR